MQLFSGSSDSVYDAGWNSTHSIPWQQAYELSDTSLEHDVSAKAVSNAA